METEEQCVYLFEGHNALALDVSVRSIINKITFTTRIFQSHPVFEIQGDKVFNNMALARVPLNLQLCWKCLLGIL